MILLVAEVWVALALCFFLGSGVGWLLARGMRMAVAGIGGGGPVADDEETAGALVPIPEPVPVITPLPRREAAPLTIDAAPVRPAGQRAGPALGPQSVRPRPGSSPQRIRPPALAGPRQGRADPLTRIGGISRRHADRLYALGIYHFGQIAAWTPREIAWVADYLALTDEIDQEDWVGQAARLAASSGLRRPPKE